MICTWNIYDFVYEYIFGTEVLQFDYVNLVKQVSHCKVSSIKVNMAWLYQYKVLKVKRNLIIILLSFCLICL